MSRPLSTDADEPWMQTRTGRAVSLTSPHPGTIDMRNDIAPVLAVLPRYNGAAPGWTVLDHLVTGADMLIAHYRSPAAAGYFLVHDAHEAYLGDLITPVTQALACESERVSPGAGYSFSQGLKRLKRRLDEAIYAALDIPPPPAEIDRLVKLWDVRMLMTERNHLMVRPPRPWVTLERIEPIKTVGRLTPVPGSAQKRVLTYLQRLERWLPAMRAATLAAAE